MNRKQTLATAASLIFMFVLAAWCGLGLAQETPGDAARQVVDHVLRGRRSGTVAGTWTAGRVR